MLAVSDHSSSTSSTTGARLAGEHFATVTDTNMSTSTAIYPSLKAKRVVVTGGGSGIGAAIVEGFARQGADVIFVDIAVEPSVRLAAQLDNAPLHPVFQLCELTDLAAVDRFFAQVGPIDVLVNNAANDDRHSLENITPQYWDERMAVNLRHLLFCTKAAVPGMKSRGGGAIVNFGSISWHLGLTDLVLHETAKAGIEGMTRRLARELRPHNTRGTCVVPGTRRPAPQEQT